MTPSAEKEAEKPKLHSLLVGIQNGTVTLEKFCSFLTKLNIQVQLYSLVNRNKNRCVYKNLYVNVCSIFIKTHPNTETIQLFSTDEWINKTICVTMDCSSSMKRNKLLTHTTIWIKQTHFGQGNMPVNILYYATLKKINQDVDGEPKMNFRL